MARIVLYKSQRGQPLLEVDEPTFNALEEYIRWAEEMVPRKFPMYMESLVHRMALVNQGEARKMSYGADDPSQKNPEAAWRIPVRRISQRYYLGWKVKAIRDGWMLYNDSREAYFIEFGINWIGADRRIRRPVRKLSLIRTLRFMETTGAYHRVWANIYKYDGRSKNFTQIIQSPGMGSFAGPALGRQLPGTGVGWIAGSHS